MTIRRIHLWSVATVAAVVVGSAGAQTVRSGGADTAQLVQRLQQVTAEHVSLQAENERLARELEALKREIEGTRAERTALQQKVRRAEAGTTSGAAQAEALAKSRSQLDDLVVKFRETAQTLRDVEADRNSLRQRSDGAARELKRCSEGNVKLIAMNEEILERLENTGLWARVAASEPFIGRKRTELENLASEYRAAASDLAVPPHAPKP